MFLLNGPRDLLKTAQGFYSFNKITIIRKAKIY